MGVEERSAVEEKSKKDPKARKPKARNCDVVVGCIEERVSMLSDTGTITDHKERLMVLLDELRRALNGKEDNAE